MMPRYAVVCGLLRFPLETALTLKKLFKLRAAGLLDGIVVSTWTPELAKEPELVSWMRGNGVTIVHSFEHEDRGPTMLYTQSRAVWIGLGAVPDGADVIKLRTDKTSEMLDRFVPFLEEGTAGDAFAPGAHSAYSRKVAVLWPHVGRPFYFGDQAYFGTKADVGNSLNFDARFHLTMEGLNPETKWWIKPIYSKFSFWRGYFENTDQLYIADFLRAALAARHAPPKSFYDIVAATLRGMHDGFLFTVRTPTPAGVADGGIRYSDLFAPPGKLNALAYDSIAAGRRTMSLRDARSLDALVAGEVEDCPLATGMKAALRAQVDAPPADFDADEFRAWVDSLENVPRSGPIAPRPFHILRPSQKMDDAQDDLVISLVSRTAGNIPESDAVQVVAVLEDQLSRGLPASRAIFRTALILQAKGLAISSVNALITTAANQKINEAAVELAIRAVEGQENVDGATALRNLGASVARGLPEAAFLQALLAMGYGGTTPDRRLAESAFAAAVRLGSPDAALMAAIRRDGAAHFDLAALQSYGSARGLAPAHAGEFTQRMNRLLPHIAARIDHEIDTLIVEKAMDFDHA